MDKESVSAQVRLFQFGFRSGFSSLDLRAGRDLGSGCFMGDLGHEIVLSKGHLAWKYWEVQN